MFEINTLEFVKMTSFILKKKKKNGTKIVLLEFKKSVFVI